MAADRENVRARNPKRLYYISMEFLIGRSLSNNVTNLMLSPVSTQAVREKNLDWIELLEQEPDAGLGNGGLGRLAACFIESAATMHLPAMGYGLRYEYGIFKQSIEDGWQHEQADNWLCSPTHGNSHARRRSVEVGLNCSFELSGGSLRVIPERPSTLIGIPYDRPVVGYGGNHQHAASMGGCCPDYFDFEQFGGGDFVGGACRDTHGRYSHAGTLSRRLDLRGSSATPCAGIFSSGVLIGGCGASVRADQFGLEQFPDKAAIQLNDTHPALAVPELMRILLDDAHLGWDEAWDITRKHWLTQITHCCRKLSRSGRFVVRTNAAAPVGDHLRNQSSPAG